MKIDWLYLCLDMMVNYIPEEIVTWENYNKHHEIYDHFINIATVLSARMKAERNIDYLMIDESETTEKIAQIIRRTARQNLDFAKRQQEDNKMIAASAVRKYEKILYNEKLCASHQIFLENQIHKLKLILKEMEGA